MWDCNCDFDCESSFVSPAADSDSDCDPVNGIDEVSVSVEAGGCEDGIGAGAGSEMRR